MKNFEKIFDKVILDKVDKVLKLNGKLDLLTEVMRFTVEYKDDVNFRDLFIDFIIAKQKELERESNAQR